VRPVFTPPLAPLPLAPDVVVVGAGAAGIAAARRLRAAGLAVAILEARDRIGGRAVTVALRGHPVDLGAHWLHAGPINPLVALGRERRERLYRAPPTGHLIVGGRPRDRRELDRAFDLADRAMTHAAQAREDQPAARVLPPMGFFGARVAAIHGLVSGRPLSEVSLHDFPSMEYSDNVFIKGGLGAYVARLAAGLPVRLCAAVTAVDWSGKGVTVTGGAGALPAKAVLITVPMTLLKDGAIRFTPALPEATATAIGGFIRGVYEHVVLNWPRAPFRGADRITHLVGAPRDPPGLLTFIEGAPFHLFELDSRSAESLDGRDAQAPARLARAVMAAHFGARAVRAIDVLTATAWRHDPWSRASWAVVPPGLAPIRDALRAPVADRIWFTGEALSRAQWGTVGGAWQEGERAADEIVAALAGQAPRGARVST
jgi:monoamine oxidase